MQQAGRNRSAPPDAVPEIPSKLIVSSQLSRGNPNASGQARYDGASGRPGTPACRTCPYLEADGRDAARSAGGMSVSRVAQHRRNESPPVVQLLYTVPPLLLHAPASHVYANGPVHRCWPLVTGGRCALPLPPPPSGTPCWSCPTPAAGPAPSGAAALMRPLHFEPTDLARGSSSASRC